MPENGGRQGVTECEQGINEASVLLVARIKIVVGGVKVRKHPFRRVLAHRLAQGIRLVPTHTGARHSRIDGQVIRATAVRLTERRPGGDVRRPVQRGANTQEQGPGELRGEDGGEAQDARSAPRVAQGRRLVEGGNAKPPRGLRGCRRPIEGHAEGTTDRDGANAVRIGFHHHHQRHAGVGAQLAHIVAQGVEIDVEPSAIGRGIY